MAAASAWHAWNIAARTLTTRTDAAVLAAVYSHARSALIRDREARHDPLTGLPNRVVLAQRLRELAAKFRAKQEAEKRQRAEAAQQAAE